MSRWKLVQLGLDDQYKRLNEVRGKERLPNTQVDDEDHVDGDYHHDHNDQEKLGVE